MSDKRHRARIRDLRFVEPTTLLNDYRDPASLTTKDAPPYVRPKREKPPQKFTPVKYIETLQNYKDDPVPFNIFIRPNPILGVNPRALQKPFEESHDEGRREAQRTRPRLIVSPAMALDDIKEDGVRSLVIADMYQSDKGRAERILMESIDRSTIRAPLGNTFAIPKPIFLPAWRPPVVPPEWRMESRYWDRNNTRGYSDPTAEFWLKRIAEKKSLSESLTSEK